MMKQVRTSAAVVLALVVAGIVLSPAHAKGAELSDILAPQRQFTGTPSAALVENSVKVMDVVTRHDDTFAGGAFSADYSYLEIFHTGSVASANQLLAASDVPSGTYRLTAVRNSARDLAQDILQIRQAAEQAGIAWTTMTPNFLVDGVDVGIPREPTRAQVREIFDLLGPLGMERLGVVPQGALFDGSTGDVYSAPGIRHINGREWLTTCESYSAGQRCRTLIWATTVQQVDGKFVQVNGWAFNSLTYMGMTRAAWGTNPLAKTGSWTAADGRQWRTECDTDASGGNGCRTWAKASFITSEVVDGQRTFRWTSGWVVNNLLRFGGTEGGQPGTGPVIYGG